MHMYSKCECMVYGYVVCVCVCVAPRIVVFPVIVFVLGV